MNRKNVGNIVLFVVLSVAVLGGWWLVQEYVIPKPPPPTTPEKQTPKPAREIILALTGGGVTRAVELADWKTNFKPEVLPKPARETILALAGGAPTVSPDVWGWPSEFRPIDVTPHRLIALSGEGYNLKVLLTNRGAGVQQVTLPPFDQASRKGEPAKDSEGPEGKRYPLELVPGYYRPVDRTTVLKDGPHHYLQAGEVGKDIPAEVQLTLPSYVLMHYERPDDPAPRPSSTLATRKWDQTAERTVTSEGGVEGREVVFETTLDTPYFIHIRKTFTLFKNEFHVRMKLEFVATADRLTKAPKLHYQIAGPRNVPIEGEWYASTLRNAIVGWKTPSNEARRDIQDAAHITTEWGGYKVEPQGNTFTYAAVMNQFFASALCIDPGQPDDVRKGMWAYVRATREYDQHLDKDQTPETREAFFADKPQLADITVRVAAQPIDPTADKPVEHSYWVYNGPTKVRLLKNLDLFGEDHKQFLPDTAVVDDKYIDALGLTSMTDAASPNWFGKFAEFIHWTDLVVWFTNRMHDILGWMHKVVPIWVVNILMLTVMVRLLLMIPSRRQQAGMMKMQEKMSAMKPELDKLQEKYKADPQRLNQEKTRLMLQHGVNPMSSMGGCLLMFAQMPVFLGLYYCLQESIFFRLHGTWSWWMPNLAAPDMLFPWSESIPFISSADQIGHSWYLGPFVNILPVVAVSLMYLNFKISSPPPTDEQQEMQQRMMKFMMIFMGVFFYKMAAGLCVYFICSTLWGLTERWLLKRKKKAVANDPLAMPSPTLVTSANKPVAPPKPPGFFEKVKQGLLEKLEEAQKQAESKGQQIINNPQQKPPQGGPPAPGTNGTGKRKKKKRK